MTTITNGTADQASTTSVAHQTEVLRSVDADRYTLGVQATVQFGGKQIVGQWRDKELSTALGRTADRVEHLRLDGVSIPIESIEVPCQVWELSYQSESRRLVDRIYYSESLAPHILLREAMELGEDPNAPRAVEKTEIIGLNLPYEINGSVLDCTYLLTTNLGPKGRTVEISFSSPSVPGGVAGLSSKEVDGTGQLIRTQRVKLIDYGLTWEASPPRQLPRRQQRRLNRRSR